ncbi:uncharacterized protein BDZ99DRAFT_518086 [Mytilinidion resinicola]|uniref:Helicase C-terminal domain-containing protein n=1 Tax=Mytilinidion resinicola TaxID=574789 RepID=A0A6A6YTY1_9PEZI|nr:uncharacterized protein BDZ99DRAFT_518086 [Mytilinidion resinicola]KAF2812230.1 hypothetical protein BDZ99DRAFT_518086 [Mytilinidion resinicola]
MILYQRPESIHFVVQICDGSDFRHGETEPASLMRATVADTAHVTKPGAIGRVLTYQSSCLLAKGVPGIITLDIVQTEVLRKLLPSVQYMRLDGGVEACKRQDIINKFNSDPSYDVLLLTISVGGLELDLTDTDTIIFVKS